MEFVQEVTKAHDRIAGYIRRTYCEHSPYYSNRSGANVFLKLENLQHTGAFKARGALNKVLSLDQSLLSKPIVTASTGNHGAAVAFAASKVGTTAIVFVSNTASKSKIAAVKRLGADVREHGEDPIEAENFARKYAENENLPYVPPYNDPEIVAGQGTIGLELSEQMERIDAIFVAVGGGGLISGIGGYLKNLHPAIEIIGCSPENSKVMIESLELGELHGDLPSKPTLSDGTSGGIEQNAITFEMCRRIIDRTMTVTEREIAKNLVDFMDVHHMQIEGAAAVPIAALLNSGDRYKDKNVVLIICGANIGADTLSKVLRTEV